MDGSSVGRARAVACAALVGVGQAAWAGEPCAGIATEKDAQACVEHLKRTLSVTEQVAAGAVDLDAKGVERMVARGADAYGIDAATDPADARDRVQSVTVVRRSAVQDYADALEKAQDDKDAATAAVFHDLLALERNKVHALYNAVVPALVPDSRALATGEVGPPSLEINEKTQVPAWCTPDTQVANAAAGERIPRRHVLCLDATNGFRIVGAPIRQWPHLLPHQSLVVKALMREGTTIDLDVAGKRGVFSPVTLKLTDTGSEVVGDAAAAKLAPGERGQKHGDAEAGGARLVVQTHDFGHFLPGEVTLKALTANAVPAKDASARLAAITTTHDADKALLDKVVTAVDTLTGDGKDTLAKAAKDARDGLKGLVDAARDTVSTKVSEGTRTPEDAQRFVAALDTAVKAYAKDDLVDDDDDVLKVDKPDERAVAKARKALADQVTEVDKAQKEVKDKTKSAADVAKLSDADRGAYEKELEAKQKAAAEAIRKVSDLATAFVEAAKKDLAALGKALDAVEGVAAFERALPVERTYNGLVRVGFAMNTAGAVSGAYRVENLAGGEQVVRSDSRPVGLEVVVGYTQMFHRVPESSHAFRVGATAALGVLGTNFTEDLEITALRSLHVGMEFGWNKFAIAPMFTVRVVDRLKQEYAVGQAVRGLSDADLTAESVGIGFSLVVFAPQITKVRF